MRCSENDLYVSYRALSCVSTLKVTWKRFSEDGVMKYSTHYLQDEIPEVTPGASHIKDKAVVQGERLNDSRDDISLAVNKWRE